LNALEGILPLKSATETVLYVPPVPAEVLVNAQLPIVCDKQGRAINVCRNTLHTMVTTENGLTGLPLVMAVFSIGTGISWTFRGLKHLINDKYICLLHVCTSMDYKQYKYHIK
jgi:hypothetical protein